MVFRHFFASLRSKAYIGTLEKLCSSARSPFLSLCITCALFIVFSHSAAASLGDFQSETPILINEIHYNPSGKTDAAEFVELFNPGTVGVDISGWAFDGAIDYTFPDGILLAPGSYLVVAQNPDTIQRFWAQAALGPYQGRLSSQGEELILRDQNANTVDRVEYRLGFPWPTVGDAPGASIGLIHPALNNALGAAWRSAQPTPNLRNGSFTEDPPPLISEVTHLPQQPAAQQAVQISAQIVDSGTGVHTGIRTVFLDYQIVEPGNYITLDSPEYATNWIQLPMVRVEADSDDKSNGVLYRAEIPADTQQHRRLIRYRVHVRDAQGATVTVPYADDPQPNFAYFVYNGVPPWQGAIRPGSDSDRGAVVSHDFNAMRPLATYHLLSQHDDIRAGLFSSLYRGSDYLWQGALVYNGIVYDHIRYRARGGTWRYSLGKNMIKFDFNRGHWFHAYDDYGNPYRVPWDKLNLASVIQHGDRKHRGEQGLFEAVGYRLFNLAGVESPKTHFIHFRVIDTTEEAPHNQYDGDFFGLYLVVEQMDGQFLKEHDLPDGNLYKMEHGSGKSNNQGAESVTDRSDLDTFINTYRFVDVEDAWWRINLDLARYYSFRSILEAIHHYDVNNQKNYFYYNNPDTGKWSILPWDIDQTWADNMWGSGTEPFKKYGVLRKETFKREYQNRMRELRDLLFNLDQVPPIIAEYAAMIDSPAGGISMVDADRARWDFAKEMDSDWTVPQKAGRGRFYQISPTDDFSGMARIMQEWTATRGAWIDKEILEYSENENLPTTPSVAYSGPAGYPADLLNFVASPFQDPQGANTFAAIKWRIAELNYPALPAFRADEPNRYEIEPTWESEVLTTFTGQFQPPAGSCRPGSTCRVRVRMLDTSGRWSHWSAPAEFVAGAPAQPATNALHITELMYNPLNTGSRHGSYFEFVEIQNVGTQPVDLTNMRFGDGINYRFPIGASLLAKERLVLAANAEDFLQRYGFAPFGDYDGQLNNGGERLLLEDAFGRPLVEVDYSDDTPWPSSADGSGRSLVLRKNEPVFAPDDGSAWRASTTLSGSPNAADPLPVVINEVLANPKADQTAGVELHNPTTEDAYVGNWYLTHSLEQTRQYQLPDNVILPPDGYYFIPQDELKNAVGGAAPLLLDPRGNTLELSAATADGRLIGYRHHVTFAGSAPGMSLGRTVDSVGREHFVAQSIPTLGAQNASPIVGPIVVSTIMYHPQSSEQGGDEFIELTNISTATVPLYDPTQPELTWRIQGIDYQFPTGLELAPNGRILVTLGPAENVCLSSLYHNLLGEVGSFENDVQAVGPYTRALPDVGGSLILQRPMQMGQDAKVAYITIDAVDFSNSRPWPTDANGTGGALTRRSLQEFGNEPANWTSSQPLRAATTLPSGPNVNLCSFSAFRGEGAGVQIHWAAHAETDVAGYHLLRSAAPERTSAVRISRRLIATSSSSAGDRPGRSVYAFVDEELVQEPGESIYYWLQAIGPNGEVVDVAITELRPESLLLYLPEVRGK